jgi:hypothetical protein
MPLPRRAAPLPPRRPRATSRTEVARRREFGAAVLFPRVVSKGSPSDETGGFFASHPVLIPAVVVAAIVILIVVWPRLKPWLREQWRKGKQGLAIFSDWRRYASEVALPSGASYCCRIGVNVVFMAAFDIPVTAYTVALVASSHMLSGLFAITPGGVGQTQALDVATLGRHAPTENVAAFSVTQDSVLMMWNVVLGAALMLWAPRARRDLLRGLPRSLEDAAGLLPDLFERVPDSRRTSLPPCSPSIPILSGTRTPRLCGGAFPSVCVCAPE